MHLKHCSHIPGSNLSVTTLLHPCQQQRATHDDYRNLSSILPRKWDVIQKVGCHLYYQKPASTFFLPGTDGILSQLTHCSTPVQLSRGWWSKWLADFTSCRCYIRLYTERLLSLTTRDADLAQAQSQMESLCFSLHCQWGSRLNCVLTDTCQLFFPLSGCKQVQGTWLGELLPE